MKRSIQSEAPALEPDYDALVIAVEKISKSMTAIGQTRMTRRMLVTLLYDMTKIPKRDIESVLDGIEGLERHYLKKREGK